MHTKMGISTAGHVFIYLVRPGSVTVHIYDRWMERLLLQEFAFGFMMLALQVSLVLLNLQYHCGTTNFRINLSLLIVSIYLLFRSS